jgi:hypothetical protein
MDKGMTQTNGSDTLAMQEQINFLAWLHAEQRFEYMELVGRVVNLGKALAGLLAQQAQPQIQQQLQEQILNQLMDGNVLNPKGNEND